MTRLQLRGRSRPLSERAKFTYTIAMRIRLTGFRFDSSWRTASCDSESMIEVAKAMFAQRCSTHAANQIADRPDTAPKWLDLL